MNDLPVRGKTSRILRDMAIQFRKTDLRLVAGSLSYSTLLSLFPFIALTLATLKSVGGLESIEPMAQSFFLDYFRETIGPESAVMIKKIIARIQPNTLGASSAIILVMTSWGLLHNIEIGIQKMWGEGLKRPLMHRIFMSWLLLLLAPIVVALYFSFRSMEAIKPMLKNYGPFFDLTLVALGIYFLYKLIPDSKVRSKYALIAAVFTTGALALLKKFYTLLAIKVFLLSKFYGSLAAIPLLLFWIMMCWYIILLGVTFCWSLHKNLIEEPFKEIQLDV